MRNVESDKDGAAITDGSRVEAASASDGFLDADSWGKLTRTSSLEVFAENWLQLQCEQLPGADVGVVVLRTGRGNGEFAPVAIWPQNAELEKPLMAVAEAALGERRGVIRRSPNHGNIWLVAYPVLVDSEPVGVVAISAECEDNGRLPGVMRRLQWGTSWIESFYRRRNLVSKGSIGQVLDAVAITLENDGFRAAAMALVTELAQTLACDRISVGFRDKGQITVAAFSHSADFSEKINLMRSLAAAMDEAADQQSVLIYPEDRSDAPRILRAHEALAAAHSATSICTVPLTDGEDAIGAMVFERSGPFERHELELFEHIGSLVGPILQIKRLEERWLGAKALDTLLNFRDRLFGPRHPGLKLTAAAATLVLLVLSAFDGTYRVTADAALEGVIQRAVTAPIDGYVAESSVRAGDIVEAGQVLAQLDERDFQLEHVRWISEREKYRREYSRALADGDRGSVRVLSAQIEQADAQIQLLDEQLARTRITAPIDGIVVAGDLSQSLSAPVGRGDVLFEVAPLDAYRVVLAVDERDIAEVTIGQQGQVALTGAPGDPVAIRIERVTPVASVVEGQNRFRVEAELLGGSPLLRPGMEGVAKVDIGDRSLMWIYTHKLVHWSRLWLWRILP